MRIAIYDLDKTITRRATFTPFLAFVAWRQAPWRVVLLPVWITLMIAHKAGMMDRTSLKRWGMKLMIGPVPEARLEVIGREFAQRRIASDGLMPGALRLLDEDRSAGATIAIATAAFEFYAKAFAAEVGITRLIATRWDGGGIPGGNCYGPMKKQRVLAWLSEQGIEPSSITLRFVSDSFADAPLLDMAAEPIFVTSNAPAAAKAAQRGWRVMDLSD